MSSAHFDRRLLAQERRRVADLQSAYGEQARQLREVQAGNKSGQGIDLRRLIVFFFPTNLKSWKYNFKIQYIISRPFFQKSYYYYLFPPTLLSLSLHLFLSFS
jgi:hypothetical protein